MTDRLYRALTVVDAGIAIAGCVVGGVLRQWQAGFIVVTLSWGALAYLVAQRENWR